MKSLVGGGEVEVFAGGRVETSGEALILERVEMSDMGVWTCIANNSVGSHKKAITLHVSFSVLIKNIYDRSYCRIIPLLNIF